MGPDGQTGGGLSMNRSGLLTVALVLASWGIFVILVMAVFYPHVLAAFWKWLISHGSEYT